MSLIKPNLLKEKFLSLLADDEDQEDCDHKSTVEYQKDDCLRGCLGLEKALFLLGLGDDRLLLIIVRDLHL